MDLCVELKQFYRELKEYRDLIKAKDSDSYDKSILDFTLGFPINNDPIKKGEEFREQLVRKSGQLSSKVVQLTGKEYWTQFGQTHNIWGEAFREGYTPVQLTALNFAVDAVNEAIGKLESEAKSWGISEVKTSQTAKIYKGFISHGKENSALTKIERFLRELGVEPLIVKERANLDKTIDDKVNYYLNQSDFVIVLASADDKIDNKMYPRQNVVHEIGLAQKTHPGKIIYTSLLNTPTIRSRDEVLPASS